VRNEKIERNNMIIITPGIIPQNAIKRIIALSM
jgi:hypothetical protein